MLELAIHAICFCNRKICAWIYRIVHTANTVNKVLAVYFIMFLLLFVCFCISSDSMVKPNHHFIIYFDLTTTTTTTTTITLVKVCICIVDAIIIIIIMMFSFVLFCLNSIN
jgi:hypothetical protein